MFVFDTLGLASPVLITGKCMLQDKWRSRIDWDKTIEADEHKKWLKWVNEIGKLASIRIPRCISPGHTEGEIYVSVDASERSYAAAVYWRMKVNEHENAVSLIAGKARVALLKVTSIPRLELQVALLSALWNSSISNEIRLILYEILLTHYDAPPGARRLYISCAGRGRYRARYSWHRAKMKIINEVCRKCRLRRVICLPNAYVIPTPLHVYGAYFGPIGVTIGRRHESTGRYSCLTTRAVHIELAESLSSNSMILALRRFIARRGTPSDVFGQRHNFVGAK
ncbi:hypothetical protein EVAR_32346_1 [Eumeta japonica]|uniref:Uncharacterized protein n=1 Tax=Eumeta variegata TaxID=151549 RepID=A0A4C1ZAI4_EUMVA|nr:hypothetical protein EVAR_32346_1 [Eumeta japonica]